MTDKRTCLYDKHIALGAKMVPFGGFEMPIQYTDIVDEHNAVRKASGVFDVSHMGEFIVRGPGAVDFVNHVTTNDVAVLDELFWDSPHAIRYGAVENLYGFDQIKAFRAARSPQGADHLISLGTDRHRGTLSRLGDPPHPAQPARDTTDRA